MYYIETEVIGVLEDQPIGVFDSGVGGLTVVRVLLERLPREKVIYLGDTAHLPYGSRTVEELKSFAAQIADFLVGQRVKMIVAACNTSSAVSLGYLRENYALPIVGVIEPGIRRALEVTRNGRIGVMATEATVKSGAFSQAARRIDHKVNIISQSCPRLVPLVESGQLEGIETEQACREYLDPLISAGVDTVILGCTHYPILRSVIQRIVGDAATLVDPALETVVQVQEMLQDLGKLNQWREGCIEHRFYSTGTPDSLLEVGQLVLGNMIQKVVQIDLESEV